MPFQTQIIINQDTFERGLRGIKAVFEREKRKEKDQRTRYGGQINAICIPKHSTNLNLQIFNQESRIILVTSIVHYKPSANLTLRPQPFPRRLLILLNIRKYYRVLHAPPIRPRFHRRLRNHILNFRLGNSTKTEYCRLRRLHFLPGLVLSVIDRLMPPATRHIELSVSGWFIVRCLNALASGLQPTQPQLKILWIVHHSCRPCSVHNKLLQLRSQRPHSHRKLRRQVLPLLQTPQLTHHPIKTMREMHQPLILRPHIQPHQQLVLQQLQQPHQRVVVLLFHLSA